MLPKDETIEKLSRVAFPMDPSKIILSLCNFDEGVYKCIYRAQINYLKACSDAESAMYANILKCLEPRIRKQAEKK
jgi:hypothetical protein